MLASLPSLLYQPSMKKWKTVNRDVLQKEMFTQRPSKLQLVELNDAALKEMLINEESITITLQSRLNMCIKIPHLY